MCSVPAVLTGPIATQVCEASSNAVLLAAALGERAHPLLLTYVLTGSGDDPAIMRVFTDLAPAMFAELEAAREYNYSEILLFLRFLLRSITAAQAGPRPAGSPGGSVQKQQQQRHLDARPATRPVGWLCGLSTEEKRSRAVPTPQHRTLGERACVAGPTPSFGDGLLRISVMPGTRRGLGDQLSLSNPITS